MKLRDRVPCDIVKLRERFAARCGRVALLTRYTHSRPLGVLLQVYWVAMGRRSHAR